MVGRQGEIAMSDNNRPADPAWESKVRESFGRQTFMRFIGARIAALSPGRCAVELPFRADLCEQSGLIHGGVVTAIAANAAGYAAFSLMPANSSVLGIEYKVNLDAPTPGKRFVATGAVVRAGRTLSVVESEVRAETDGGSHAVARMLATMMCSGKAEAGHG
jgi:uncharacterized protein (TIGR00369 family)